jgi:type II secretory pathway pseudopilin PulG
MRPHAHRGSRVRLHAAFTLVEVLLAIALMLALMGAMFGFAHAMMHARQRINEGTARHRAATALIERLEADLATCIAGDQALGAGVVGDESSLRVLTRGVSAHLAESDPDAAFFDLQRAEYRFDAARGRIELRRGLAAVGADAGDAGGPFHSLGGAMSRVRFRYHDGGAWRGSFDSLASDRLPAAVEVAVWFDGGADAVAGGAEELEEPDRLTFDAGAGFDEEEWAMRADRDFRRESPPDRVRVIAIIDPGEEGAADAP